MATTWRFRGGLGAMVETALCLALFTPIVLAGLRLAEGTGQMHDLALAVNDAAPFLRRVLYDGVQIAIDPSLVPELANAVGGGAR